MSVVSKLNEVIDAATGDTVPIPSLLRMLKTLASELESAPLAEWADLELSGYLDPEALPPPYRGPFKVDVIARWTADGLDVTVPLPSTALPEAMRKAPYELVFRQSVSELQKLALSARPLVHPWPADAVAKVNDMISRGQVRREIPMGKLVHAYRQFSPALIDGILDAIRTRALDLALALQRDAPDLGEAGATLVDPTWVQGVIENWGQEHPSAPAWDIHIGYNPPRKWADLPDTDHARKVFGGHRKRPQITVEPIPWKTLRMTPRWVGDDTSNAVAAIQPSIYFNQGAAEWERFIAGTKARRELALAISMVGGAEEPDITLPGGPTASVSLPVPERGIAHVGGRRIPLSRPPSVANDLGSTDRDLALRLLNVRDPDLPWWSLELTGADVFYGGGGRERVSPTGTLAPLLVSTSGEVVAAVWTSPDQTIRHYVIPWLPAWSPILEWLRQRGIPDLVLSTRRDGQPKAGASEAVNSEPAAVGSEGTTAPSTTGTAAPVSPSQRDPEREADDRVIGYKQRSRVSKTLGAPFRAVWDVVRKHGSTTVGATVATVAGGLILFFILPESGSRAPDTPATPSPTASSSPAIPTVMAAPTTTASSTNQPAAAPHAPPEEQVIHAGGSGEFFQREVIVGVGSAFSNWSALIITTSKLSCNMINLDVGEAVSVAGKNEGRDDFFRVTLLQSAPDASSTVRVEELPFPDWPTGIFCPR